MSTAESGGGIRLLHLIATLEKAGGAQRLLLSLLEGLPRYRHTVAVLSGAFELERELAALGAEVLDLRRRSLLDPIGHRAVRALVARERFPAVTCHLSRAEIVGTFALARRRDVRMLVFKQSDDPWWKGRVLGAVHDRVMRRADRVVCVSDFVLEYFAALAPAARPKMTRIHNGIDVAAFSAAAAAGDRQAVRASLGVPVSAPLLVSVGRLERLKGHDVLVRALAEPPLAAVRAHAVLVGRGDEASALEALARERGVADRVVFAGLREDVPAVMGAADAVVVPSRREGFGLVAAEAMAAGRPVIASRASALPEVVADGESGFVVPPEDAAALAAAAARVLSDESLRTRMGAAGRERAARLFTRERMLAEWRREYERLLSPPSGVAVPA